MPNRPNEYDIGDEIQCSATFTANGTDADPDTVTARLREPDGTETTPSAAQDGTGKYHFDATPTQAGWHYYRFEGAGTVNAQAQGRFYVRPTAF